MTEPRSDMAAIATGARRAADLRPVTPDEANRLEAAELERLLALLESLPPDAWFAPVLGAPRNWNVKALVAQIAGGYAAQASLSQFRRLANPRTLRFYHIAGRSLRETIRQVQVGDRLYRTPDELIAELRTASERALRTRALAFRPLAYFSQPGNRTLRIPDVPLGPFTAVRDLWFHRFTIGALAGRPFRLESGHDDRIVEGLLLPAAAPAERALAGVAVELALEGLAELRLRFGVDEAPSATIVVAPEPFALLVSRRRSAAWAREHATIEGSVRAAMVVLTSIAATAEHRPY